MQDLSIKTFSSEKIQFLSGGGEMGKLIRAKDWSKTPLGDPKDWPQSLRTMVSVMLDNPFGMYIAWGKDYIQLYNDSYRPILGSTKHPQALGISTRETFAEIWHIIESMFDNVMKGKAVGFPDFMLPLNRNGFVEECYFDFSYSPIRKEDGEVGGVLVTVIETTNKKKAEDELKKSEERFRTMADNIPNLAWMANADGSIFWYNKKWYEYTGTSIEQMEGWGWHSVHDPAQLPLVLNKYKQSIADGEPFEMIFPLKGADGNYRQFLTRTLPLRNSDGNIYQWFGSNTDITEQKEAEKALRESEQRFRNTVRQAPVGITILRGTDFIVEMANDAYLHLVDKKEIDFIGKPLFTSLPEVKETVHPLLENVFNTGNPYHGIEYPIPINRYGKLEISYFDFLYYPLKEKNGKISGIIVTVTDVSSQVIARAKVEDSDQKLRSLLKSAPFPIGVYTGKEKRIELANEAIIKAWGKGNDVIGKLFTEVMPELSTQQIFEQLDEVYVTGKPFHAINQYLKMIVDGKEQPYYYNYSFTPLYDSSGKVYGVMNTAANVTDLNVAKKKIEESEKRFRDLIMQSPVPKAILRGKDFIIEMANTALLKNIWRKKESDVQNKKIFDVFPELKEQKYGQLLYKVYTSGKVHTESESLIYFKGDTGINMFYVDYEYAPIFETDNSITGIRITTIDVTEKVKARIRIQENEQRFRLLADSMPQHIWTSDPEGNLNYFNKSVFDYSGLSLEEITRNGWLEIVHPDDREENIKQWTNSIATGKDFLCEHRFRKFNGEYRWQLSRAVPQRDETGQIQMWVGSSTDIQDIKEQDQQKDYFISLASHELKTPITSIKAYTQILLSNYINNKDPFLIKSLNVIDKQVLKLTNLISDLLDLSKIKSGSLPLHKENFYINELIQEVIDEIKHINPDYQITFFKDANITLYGDRERIGQVVINFLTNAVKYSPDSRKIKVTCFNENNNLVVTVEDYGIGINKNDQEKIFERFYRVEGKNEKTFPGFGIGLFISMEIIHRHNGNIGVKSEPGKGSVFYFKIPL